MRCIVELVNSMLQRIVRVRPRPKENPLKPEELRELEEVPVELGRRA